MTTIELARKLGAQIQESEQYKRLEKAKIANDADEALQDEIGQLNLLRIKYNTELSKEDGQDKEKVESYNTQFRALYTKIMANPNMLEYNVAKQEIDDMMNEITAILAMCVNGEDPETCEVPSSGCSSDCSSCSGCH